MTRRRSFDPAGHVLSVERGQGAPQPEPVLRGHTAQFFLVDQGTHLLLTLAAAPRCAFREIRAPYPAPAMQLSMITVLRPRYGQLS